MAQTTELYLQAAVAHGATLLDYRTPLAAVVAARGGDLVYGATGYDLLWPGHEVIEPMVREWLEGVGVLGRLSQPILAGAV